MKVNAVSVLLAVVCLTTTTQALLQQNASLPELYERASGGGGKTGSRTGSGSRGGGRLAKAPELPEPLILAGQKPTKEDSDRFSLGEYKIESPRQLFHTFEDPADVNFFAQVFTFFAAQPDAELSSSDDTYAKQEGEKPFDPQQPIYQDNKLPLTGQPLRFTRVFQDDVTSISTFQPRQSTGVCGAWSSLAGYCAEGGTDCACYSGSYYVPEMWNSLAAGCAAFFDPNQAYSPGDYWYQLGKTASEYSDWCATELADGTTTARFAQHANVAVATSTADADAGEETDAPAAAAQAPATTAPRTTAAAATTTSTHTTTTTTPTTSSTSLSWRTTPASLPAVPTSSGGPMTGSASSSRALSGQCWWLLSFALPLLYVAV